MNNEYGEAESLIALDRLLLGVSGPPPYPNNQAKVGRQLLGTHPLFSLVTSDKADYRL